MKVLVVVDMQNDFVSGNLGTKEAVAIVPNVKKKIEEYSTNGDLRDYGDFDEIEKWFNKCCDKFFVRQAVCQVEVEGVGTKIFQNK